MSVFISLWVSLSVERIGEKNKQKGLCGLYYLHHYYESCSLCWNCWKDLWAKLWFSLQCLHIDNTEGMSQTHLVKKTKAYAIFILQSKLNVYVLCDIQKQGGKNQKSKIKSKNICGLRSFQYFISLECYEFNNIVLTCARA